MRVTVTFDDDLHSAAKQRAQERGVTLSAIVEAGLLAELAAPEDANGESSSSTADGPARGTERPG